MLGVLILENFILTLEVTLPISYLLTISNYFMGKSEDKYPYELILSFYKILNKSFSKIFNKKPNNPSFSNGIERSNIRTRLIVATSGNFILARDLSLATIRGRGYMLVPHKETIIKM